MLITTVAVTPVDVKVLKKSCVLLAEDVEGNTIMVGYNNLYELKKVVKMLMEKIEEAEKSASETIS